MDSTLEEIFKKILNGKCILFLGAGASKSSGGLLGNELAECLSKKFINDYVGPHDLTDISDLIMNQPGVDRIELNKEVHTLFTELKPSSGYKLIPTFEWLAIYTTNYDKLIELSYETANAKQKPLTIYKGAYGGETMRLFDRDYVHIFKLHGCVSKALTDFSVPLVLTTDDIKKSEKYRWEMLCRMKDFMQSGPIIFVGYSFRDGLIYRLFDDIKNTIGEEFLRWSYAVFPKMKEYEINYYKNKKIIPIDLSFDEFFNQLERYRSNNPQFITKPELIRKYKTIELLGLSQQEIKNYDDHFEFLDDYVMESAYDCKNFFRGNEPSWGDINESCDAIRDITSDMEDLIIEKYNSVSNEVTTILITGPAGSGKTSLLRRIAYDMRFKHQLDVISMREERIEWDFQTIEDLFSRLGNKLIIIIDNAPSQMVKIKNLYQALKYKSIPSIIITAGRSADWSLATKKNYIPVTKTYSLKDTLEKIEEVKSFIQKLVNKGYLKIDPISSIDYWSERLLSHEGNLLTFLREVADGKGRFDEIILSEYGNLFDALAQKAYLYISALFTYKIKTKRELLRRVLNCSWGEFTDKILKPTLEIIIEDPSPTETGRYFFRARHSIIAKVIYDNVLDLPEKKLQTILDIIKNIVISDDDERKILYDLILNDSVKEDFKQPENVRDFFNTIIQIIPNDDVIMHQYGLYEMDVCGNLENAEKIFERALQTNKSNEAAFNSLGILYRRKAEHALKSLNNPILMRNFFRKSETFFNKQRQLNRTSEYSYDPHIRTLWEWTKLEKELAHINTNPIEKEEALTRADKLLGDALYLCEIGISTVPQEEQNILTTLQGQLFAYLGNIEGARSNFSKILQDRPDHHISRYLWAKLEYQDGNYPKALELIDKAIARDQKDPMFFRLKVLILEKQYGEDNQLAKVIIDTLEKALSTSTEDLSLWFNYGYYSYILNYFDKSNRAFVKTRDLSQGLMARFKVLKELHNSYMGAVSYCFKNRGFIKLKNTENTIYFNPLYPENDQSIKQKDNVSFKIGFNYLGPIAINIKKL